MQHCTNIMVQWFGHEIQEVKLPLILSTVNQLFSTKNKNKNEDTVLKKHF